VNSGSSYPQSAGDKARVTAWGVGILGTFLITAVLVAAMRYYARPEPVGANRAEERRKNLNELRAADTKTSNEYDWQDKDKGIVRLPVQRAMELTLQEWKNPAAARSNLVARVDKATVVPPKAPEKPNPFE